MSLNNICPFCDSSQTFRHITETSAMRVIYPKNPAIKFHILITPKRHIKHINELSQIEESELFVLLKNLTSFADRHLGDQYLGFNLLSNNGDESINQRVPHAHMHVFLRTIDDKLDPIKSHHGSKPKNLSDKEIKNLLEIKEWFLSPK